MITFKFQLEKQKEYYKKVEAKLKTQFYQDLKFYILSRMPEKFRNRIVFLPEICDSELIYRKHKREITNLETEWERAKQEFIVKITKHFPEFNSINILISPTLYGSMGSFEIENNKIIVCPRYDRKVIGLHKLIISGVVKFCNPNLSWNEVQNEIAKIQSDFYPKKKSLLKILDTEFAGKLAEESAQYLEKLKLPSKKVVTKPDGLTKAENIVFNLLLRNKNKLVSFDEIANWLWEDKSEEKYSEYAITKLIERLKKKLPKNLVQAQRGVGYILHI